MSAAWWPIECECSTRPHVKSRPKRLNKYRVRRLDVFGSAARNDLNEESSDVDLLVEFDDMPPADRADARIWAF